MGPVVKHYVLRSLELVRYLSADRLFCGVLVFVLYAALGASIVWHSWEVETWPFTHDQMVPFSRLFIYVEHFAQLDFLPIWSVKDNFTAGSPQPLLYHKAFYLAAASFYFVSGFSLKNAMALGIVFYSMVGSYGMKRLVRFIGGTPFIAFCGGVMMAVANYSITNFLIRGAHAEYSACMFMPWFIWALLRSLDQKRVTKSLGFFSAAVILGHTAFAFFALLIGGFLAFVYALATRRILAMLDNRFWQAALVFAITAGIYLVPMAIIGKDYDLTRLGTQYVPRDEFVPLYRYFWDSDWRFGENFFLYTVQIDLVPMAFTVLGVLAALPGILARLERGWAAPVVRVARQGLAFITLRPRAAAAGVFYRYLPESVLNPVDGAVSRIYHLWTPVAGEPVRYPPLSARGKIVLSILPAMVLIVMLLQMRFSLPFYENFPGADFIQFPWRLLGILTPALIALSLYLVSPSATASLRRVIACNALVLVGATIMTAQCGAYHDVRWELIPRIGVEPRLYFSYTKEFVPVADTGDAYAEQHPENPTCTVTRHETAEEALNVPFTVECREPALVVLPIFGSPGHILVVGGHVQQVCHKAELYPALCAVPLPAGVSEVLVEMPTMARLYRAMLVRLGTKDESTYVAPGKPVLAPPPQ
ncbi:MAG: hypothetical protein LBR29_05315 [Methylobacteriaceae bacterium]|nr:hypothetical protein [Methylobacteriaceae bacterium]